MQEGNARSWFQNISFPPKFTKQEHILTNTDTQKWRKGIEANLGSNV